MKTIYLQDSKFNWVRFEFENTQQVIDKRKEIGNEVKIGNWVAFKTACQFLDSLPK